MYTTEYYPTKIRNTSLGNLAGFARVSGIFSPVLCTVLAEEWVSGPYMLFCCLTVAAAVANVLLDEDNHGRSLDTIKR